MSALTEDICIDCFRRLNAKYVDLRRCERCYLKYALNAPCAECGLAFTGHAIDTESPSGEIERFHRDCWEVASEKYATGVYKVPEAMIKPRTYVKLEQKAKALTVGWSKSFSKCLTCNTTLRPHYAQGNCEACYLRLRRKRKEAGFTPIQRYEWSYNYPACIMCNSTENPHQAKGRCKPCYKRYWRAVRKTP